MKAVTRSKSVISIKGVSLNRDALTPLVPRRALVKVYGFYLVASMSSTAMFFAFFFRAAITLSPTPFEYVLLALTCASPLLFSSWLYRAFVGASLRKFNLPEPTRLGYLRIWFDWQVTAFGNAVAAVYGVGIVLMLWSLNDQFRQLLFSGWLVVGPAFLMTFVLTQFAAFRRIFDNRLCPAPARAEVGWNTLALNLGTGEFGNAREEGIPLEGQAVERGGPPIERETPPAERETPPIERERPPMERERPPIERERPPIGNTGR